MINNETVIKLSAEGVMICGPNPKGQYWWSHDRGHGYEMSEHVFSSYDLAAEDATKIFIDRAWMTVGINKGD